jgi:deoxyribodipyrimidine photolyase-related protein
MLDWETALGLPVSLRDDDRFVCSRARFARWAEGRRQYRMEFFYREMRRETGLLMEPDGTPAGGQWNFDRDNRKPLPGGLALALPERKRFAPDAITTEVMDLVAARFGDHFGDLEPFGWPVTRAHALEALAHFVADCLPAFGDYQDAMQDGAPFLFHGLVSTSLNLGLLTAREVCDAVAEAWQAGAAPLNSVEGFVRQVLGWREYVRGIHWIAGPAYSARNHLGAKGDLPDFYWTGDTDMRCLAESIGATKRHAHAHHIQRLMVIGNFAMLIGTDPHQVHEWFLSVYDDAYEWVETPNVIGMSQFADGGLMGSKPYAGGGAYINRMSDYCKNCRYDVKARTGEGACPFNSLYWDFLARNRETLGTNHRLLRMYDGWDRFAPEEQAAIQAQASAFIATL